MRLMSNVCVEAVLIFLVLQKFIDDVTTGSHSGNVYSRAIIFAELLTRQEPFGDTGM